MLIYLYLSITSSFPLFNSLFKHIHKFKKAILRLKLVPYSRIFLFGFQFLILYHHTNFPIVYQKIITLL